MSVASVRAFLAENAPDLSVVEVDASTATVELAARALGVEPGRIAKTLALRVGERVALVVTRGDARLDSARSRAAFGAKPRMLGSEEVEVVTGHPIGGVCPFGLANPIRVYCDISLKAFAEIMPAAGSSNSFVRLTPFRLAELVSAEWIDVCKLPDAAPVP